MLSLQYPIDEKNRSISSRKSRLRNLPTQFIRVTACHSHGSSRPKDRVKIKNERELKDTDG
eukprot:5745659-Pleurochrysis_carterae.AAC.1